jgi:stress response protein YsnF
VIPLFKEEVHVGTRTVDAGTVQLRKTVETETVSEPVEIRRESVSIERLPANGEAAQSQTEGQSFAQSEQSGQNNLSQPFQEGQMEIRLQREEPVVEKRIVPAGRIVASRTSEVQQTNIQSQIRTEDISVGGAADSENVTLSQNITRSGQQSTEAMGGTADVGGQSRGGASSGAASAATITQLSQLTSVNAANASTMDGNALRLSSVRVQQAYGNRFIALQSEGAQRRPILEQLSQPQQFRTGETVSISGTIRRASEIASQSGIDEQAQQALRGQPIFIEARSVERSSNPQ